MKTSPNEVLSSWQNLVKCLTSNNREDYVYTFFINGSLQFCVRNVTIWLFALCITGLLITISGCATRTSWLYNGSGIPEGYHQVTEIRYLASKQEIHKDTQFYAFIRAAGIQDKDIQNGSFAIGRVFCCGGEGTVETITLIYIPTHLKAEKGDIVEFIYGREPTENLPPRANTVIRIRNKDGIANGDCSYLPDKPDLWLRVIHCDWMKSEGWEKQDGLYPIWFKPSIPDE